MIPYLANQAFQALALLSTICNTIYYDSSAVAEATYLITSYHLGGRFTYQEANPEVVSEEALDLPVILCLHGDHSSPATFVYLIDLLRGDPATSKMAIFAPELSYDNENDFGVVEGDWVDYSQASEFDKIRHLLSSIAAQYEAAGKPLRVIWVGHSAGGTASAYYNYCLPEKQRFTNAESLAIIAISTRLRFAEPCDWFLKPKLEKIQERFSEGNLSVPLYAIFGGCDWLVPQEGLDVAHPNQTKIIPDKSHLGTLFDSDALAHALSIIKQLVHHDPIASMGSR